MKKQNKRCMLFGLTCLLFTFFVLMTDLTSVMAVNGSGKVSGEEWIESSANVSQNTSVFTYKLNDEGNAAIITGYCGSDPVLNIPDTLDGYKVVEIGNSAFKGNSWLRTVVIPDSVTEIGSNAFSECNSLSSVTLSKTLTTVGYDVFYDCDALASIEIPKSLQIFDANNNETFGIFRACDNLKTVTFEQGTTKIVNSIFAKCNGLERIVIPDTVTQIGRYAFFGCENLREVIIPSSVTGIEAEAFGRCTSLKQITIPDSVTEIGSNAFSECSSLSSVTLSKTLTTVGYDVFYDCDALTSIEIPKSLQIFDANNNETFGIFRACDNLKTVTFEQGTTKIVNSIFAKCNGLERIVIPDTVTQIGRYAFFGCENLREVTIPSSVTEIETKAFSYCTSLKQITIPDSVTELGEYIFADCILLYDITIPDSVITIGSGAFSGCSNLSSVTLSKVLTKIDKYTFQNCSNLQTIELPDTVTNIANFAFQNCDALTTITIPDSVTSIGTYCFSNCESLSDVKLGTGLTTIPSYAFDLCPALEKVVLPYRIEKINANAFTNCTKLKEVTIPRGTTTIASNVFSYPSRMTIYGIAGTYAETYANANSITFVNQEVPATGITLNKTEMILNKGSSTTLVISITPENFTDEVTWKSSNTDVATITSAGVVKGISAGTATIRVSAGNVSASCVVTVVQPVTRVSLSQTSATLGSGETLTLTATVSPDNAYDKGLEWTSSDESVATVDQNGVVTAVKSGTAKITAKALDGSERSAACSITVTGNSQVVTSVEELESPHDYANNSDISWIYTLRGATEMTVTFDERTSMGSGFDYLYLYDGTGKQIGKYTGTELAGQTITISGDTVKIKLVSDNAGTAWGFKVSEISRKAEVSEETRDFVRRLYTLVLGRDAEGGGLDSWSEALTNFSSNGVDAGYGFVFSEECRKRNLSNDEFVEMLYNTFMNRPSDDAGRSAWVSQLEVGVDREKIFEGFVYSLEFVEICANYGISVGNVEDMAPLWETLQSYHNQNSDVTAFVARCYTKALGREYDPVGLEDWCRVIVTQEDTPTSVAKSFIFSEEFTRKNLSDEEYVKVLYRTFMGREADEGGLAGWVGVLQSGEEDREKVLEGFANSPEFEEILVNFGLNE